MEVHKCSSWTRFSPCPLLCHVCLGPDSVLHSGISATAVLHGLCCCFHAVFPFIVGRPVLKRHALLGPYPGSEVLGQVVLARRCTTPGADSVRTVRSVARGDTTGAGLGRGLGHYDRCRGPDGRDLLWPIPTLARAQFYFGQFLLWPIPTLASSTLASPTLANLKCLVPLWPVLFWPILGQQQNSIKKPKKTT